MSFGIIRRVCACGCGLEIVQQLHHKYQGTPQYRQGHASKGSNNAQYKGRDKWVLDNTGKHFCECGCNGVIRMQPEYMARGVPKWLKGHHLRVKNHMSGHVGWNKGLGDAGLRRNSWYKRFNTWEKAAILTRDNFTCKKCGLRLADNVRRLHADHITAICDGGEHSVDNGQTLCSVCHKIKSGKETSRLQKRWREEQLLKEQN